VKSIKKIPLSLIKEEDKLDYLRNYKKIKDINSKLFKLKLKDKDDYRLLKKTLKEYETAFKNVQKYNMEA